MTSLLVVVAAVGAVGSWCAARRVAARDRVRALRTGRRILPARWERRLSESLHDADVALAPGGAVQLWIGAMAATVLLSAGVAPRAGGVAVAVIAISGPLALHALRHRRDRRRVRSIPEALEMIAAEFRAGGTMTSAIRRVGDIRGPLSDDFRAIDQRIALGGTARDALRWWSDRYPSPAVAATAGSLAVALESGGAAARALDGLAESLRDRLEVHAEARALSAQARFSAMVVGLAPFGYTLFTAVLDPTTFRFLVGTNLGRMCVVVAFVLEGAATLWMRVLVREEPL